MAHEQFGSLPEVAWPDIAADPQIMEREREIYDLTILREGGTTVGWTEAHANRMRQLQERNAVEIIRQCGIPEKDIAIGPGTRSQPHIARVGFSRNGMRHVLNLDGDATEVTAWDQRLGDEGGYFASHAYIVCNTIGFHPDDERLPEHDKDYVRSILQRVPVIGEGSFNERYGFLHFKLDSPRPSWALPVALAITSLPVEEAVRITGPAERGEYNAHLREEDVDPIFWPDPRFITVPGPGSLVAESDAPIAWRLDQGGALQQGQPLSSDVVSNALMKLLDTMR